MLQGGKKKGKRIIMENACSGEWDVMLKGLRTNNAKSEAHKNK